MICIRIPSTNCVIVYMLSKFSTKKGSVSQGTGLKSYFTQCVKHLSVSKLICSGAAANVEENDGGARVDGNDKGDASNNENPLIKVRKIEI